MKKKVLFVMGHMGLGGAARALVNALWSINPEKYDVDLLLFNGEGFNLSYVPPYVNYLGVITEDNKYYERFLPLAKYLLSHGKIFDLARRIFYAVLQVFYPHKNTASDRLFQWKFLRKYLEPTRHYNVAVGFLDGSVHYYVTDKADADRKILWVHNDYSHFEVCKSSERYFEKADNVVAVSKKCADELKRIFPSLVNVCVAQNICSAKYIRKSAEAFSPLDKGEFNILCIGRLCRQKAYYLAVDAAKILKDENRKFKWYIIGDGELKGELEEQIKAHGISDCFFLIGTKENPYPYIATCDVVVQCSLYEGKSLATDEAKILAKPIVCTNYKTVCEQIENGVTGIVVPTSADGVANGVRLLMDSAELRRRLSENLKKKDFCENYNTAIYEKILDGEI